MDQQAPISNVPEWSVSEISEALKRTVEDNFTHIRVRGELSGVKQATSGHLYADLKDDKAVLNIICWKYSMPRLMVTPAEGLEVICTGKLTTYPGRSNYQMIIEQMELAGEGALLRMLEQRKKQLAAEGLFDEARKKKLPFLPQRIGVVTSPTGSVIRDILHRLRERFPRHVMVWPAKVQGEGASDEITAGINGFNAMPEHLRPDLIIVARGGGSLEDLMPFNEENVVRATAASLIPIISAVGHETDTTLIDYASDLRAPTPTGAAEIAVPRRDELLATVMDNEKRLLNAATRLVSTTKERLVLLSRNLRDPLQLLAQKQQNFDYIVQQFTTAFEKGLTARQTKLAQLSASIRLPKDRVIQAQNQLSFASTTLQKAGQHLLKNQMIKIEGLSRMLESLSFERVLDRGYAAVFDSQDNIVSNPDVLKDQDKIKLLFKDKKHINAKVEKS
jgi:exodeoxyribonuclease VII large subunit